MDRGDTRFVYICSATPNQIINVMPLVQLGLDQVDHILMLVGTHVPPTERDRQTALGHIQSFDRVLKEISSRKGIVGSLPKIGKIENPPDNTPGWQDRVACKLKQIGVGNKKPILNVTGGTRSMMFGAMAGIRDAQNGEQEPSPSWHAVVYLAHPARTEQLFPTVDKAPCYLDAMEPLTLSEHLSLRNYEEREGHARNRRETNARCRAEFTHALVGEMSIGVPQWKQNLRAMVLHGIVNDAEKEAINARRSDCAPRTVGFAKFEDTNSNGKGGKRHDSGIFWKKMFEAQPSVSGLYSTSSKRGTILFNGKAATEYFTGGWLEEDLFLRCEKILGHRTDVWIHLGVSYGDIAAKKGTDGEIDIVIQVKNDLHLIECKSGRVAGRRNPDGVDRSAIHTIATRRRQIAGPTGSARLVSFQTARTDFLSRLESEAEHSDVTFWFGSRGLELFKEWLRVMNESMKRSPGPEVIQDAASGE